MDQKTCFVISPIGEKDSDIRKNADDLFDLIIEPALEKFGFEIIRADKNLAVTSITAEIIQLVQNSDLCIVDITGHNANVMYECGRRHETGKPYIMLAKQGEKLPFDINTIRTIFYDFLDNREVRSTVKNIQGIVDKMQVDEFRPHSSGESLTSISETLKRLERKIDDISTSSVSQMPVFLQDPGTSVHDLISELGLNGAFRYALIQQDVRLCEAIIPKLEGQIPKEHFVLGVIGPTAALGSKNAVRLLEQELANLDSWAEHEVANIVHNYVAGLRYHNWEQRGIENLEGYYNNLRSVEPQENDVPAKEFKAYMMSELWYLLFGSSQFKESLEVIKEIVKLSPQSAYYYMHYSANLGKIDKREEAIIALDRSFALAKETGQVSETYLSQITSIAAELKDKSRTKEFFNQLNQVSPRRAALLYEDPEVKELLRSEG